MSYRSKPTMFQALLDLADDQDTLAPQDQAVVKDLRAEMVAPEATDVPVLQDLPGVQEVWDLVVPRVQEATVDQVEELEQQDGQDQVVISIPLSLVVTIFSSGLLVR